MKNETHMCEANAYTVPVPVRENVFQELTLFSGTIKPLTKLLPEQILQFYLRSVKYYIVAYA